MKKSDCLRMTAFLLLALTLVLSAALVFDRKTACKYTVSVNGFFHEPPDSMDVIGFGSSRLFCTLDPLQLYRETGLRSYLLPTQQQPPAASYRYMQKSFERQRQQVVLLETCMLCTEADFLGDGAVRDCLDPFPWSREKIALIRDLVPKEERSSYYFNFLNYHQRWKELSAQDFDFSWLCRRDPLRGYTAIENTMEVSCSQRDYEDVEAEPVPEAFLSQLRDMDRLARDNGARLVLLAAPAELITFQLGQLKSLHRFCEEEGIAFLDLNEIYDDTALDERTDFADRAHLNVYGARKATAAIGAYLRDELRLASRYPAPDPEIEQHYQELIQPYFSENQP